ncbi:class IV adenylate cyclase [Pelagibius sp. Alg239-R121]|uniref:class IV adenylate cyclase n=1 Tax=Pelagibius sp. Alg239-R121 TaxID=2993448 RepID=UPI0024A6A997|nr:class IV adenylate cyclase [Pelagibius sp. Alg239-R121]
MARNVEVKARVRDFGKVRQRAAELSGGLPEIIEQEDVFFQTRQGRLKLRRLAQNVGELIFYNRPDVSGPKTSTYSISHTDDPAQLRTVLADALGETVHVKKVRELYLVGPARIHLDVVEGLGEFLELEVILGAGESEQFGETIALDLMKKLGIDESELVEGAYADLLSKTAAPVAP